MLFPIFGLMILLLNSVIVPMDQYPAPDHRSALTEYVIRKKDGRVVPVTPHELSSNAVKTVFSSLVQNNNDPAALGLLYRYAYPVPPVMPDASAQFVLAQYQRQNPISLLHASACNGFFPAQVQLAQKLKGSLDSLVAHTQWIAQAAKGSALVNGDHVYHLPTMKTYAQLLETKDPATSQWFRDVIKGLDPSYDANPTVVPAAAHNDGRASSGTDITITSPVVHIAHEVQPRGSFWQPGLTSTATRSSLRIAQHRLAAVGNEPEEDHNDTSFSTEKKTTVVQSEIMSGVPSHLVSRYGNAPQKTIKSFDDEQLKAFLAEAYLCLQTDDHVDEVIALVMGSRAILERKSCADTAKKIAGHLVRLYQENKYQDHKEVAWLVKQVLMPRVTDDDELGVQQQLHALYQQGVPGLSISKDVQAQQCMRVVKKLTTYDQAMIKRLQSQYQKMSDDDFESIVHMLERMMNTASDDQKKELRAFADTLCDTVAPRSTDFVRNARIITALAKMHQGTVREREYRAQLTVNDGYRRAADKPELIELLKNYETIIRALPEYPEKSKIIRDTDLTISIFLYQICCQNRAAGDPTDHLTQEIEQLLAPIIPFIKSKKTIVPQEGYALIIWSNLLIAKVVEAAQLMTGESFPRYDQEIIANLSLARPVVPEHLQRECDLILKYVDTQNKDSLLAKASPVTGAQHTKHAQAKRWCDDAAKLFSNHATIDKGIALLQKASNQGYVPADLMLASVYCGSMPWTPQQSYARPNDQKALAYLEKCIQSGNEYAKIAWTRIKNKTAPWLEAQKNYTTILETTQDDAVRHECIWAWAVDWFARIETLGSEDKEIFQQHAWGVLNNPVLQDDARACILRAHYIVKYDIQQYEGKPINPSIYIATQLSQAVTAVGEKRATRQDLDISLQETGLIAQLADRSTKDKDAILADALATYHFFLYQQDIPNSKLYQASPEAIKALRASDEYFERARSCGGTQTEALAFSVKGLLFFHGQNDNFMNEAVTRVTAYYHKSDIETIQDSYRVVKKLTGNAYTSFVQNMLPVYTDDMSDEAVTKRLAVARSLVALDVDAARPLYHALMRLAHGQVDEALIQAIEDDITASKRLEVIRTLMQRKGITDEQKKSLIDQKAALETQQEALAANLEKCSKKALQ